MAPLQEKAEALASKTFDWLLDHFPNTMTGLLVAMMLAVPASIVWGVIAVSIAPAWEGMGYVLWGLHLAGCRSRRVSVRATY